MRDLSGGELQHSLHDLVGRLVEQREQFASPLEGRNVADQRAQVQQPVSLKPDRRLPQAQLVPAVF